MKHKKKKKKRKKKERKERKETKIRGIFSLNEFTKKVNLKELKLHPLSKGLVALL